MEKHPRLRIQRIYDRSPGEAGPAFLVDRLWPRGLRRADLEPAVWAKEVAPSDSLRRWYGHDPDLWDEFLVRYQLELDAHPQAWQPLLEAAQGPAGVTLLYAAKDEVHNNAVALADYLEAHLDPPDP